MRSPRFNPFTAEFAPAPGPDVGWSNVKYVNGTNGSDTTGTGSQEFPYATIQAALTAIGDASNTTVFAAATTSRYQVKVGPGVYTENLTVPTRWGIDIELNNAKVVGDVSWTADLSKVPNNYETVLSIRGTNLRSMYTGINIPLVGVEGNITVDVSGSSTGYRPHVHLQSVGVSGNIQFSTDGLFGYLGFVMAKNAFILGDIIVDTFVGASLYAWDCDSSTSKCIGGGSGSLTLAVLDNVIINRAMATITGNGGGRWNNVNFQSAAHNMTGYTGTIRMDANSYETYRANVPTKGSETVTLIDNVTGVAYTPTTSANWSSVPATAFAALDTIAADLTSGKVDSFNGMIETPSNKTYTLESSAKFAYTINNITIQTASGTCTVAIKINGTNVTGLSAISVTSTPQTVNATAANSVVATDVVTLVVSSNSSAADLSFSIKETR